jgi:asparagine synthetase A
MGIRSTKETLRNRLEPDRQPEFLNPSIDAVLAHARIPLLSRGTGRQRIAMLLRRRRHPGDVSRPVRPRRPKGPEQ